ncbi:hypothetical protein [Sphingopyxis sp. RIFCSPHIGHO2_12_FULL_65_19]|uniref:hypothetical protein n=1 Tax=Sphingopyxis sp. RIFCSPHIGHO2_12_FULL_65_19 TaxID=1802172 RepID=UPI0008D5FEAF|nr:hypothetical protein [Sphingopyxis sp. RIFCSPHIGHO2_12_FULL_65_19]OHD09697.1 MAG: hypothetical protein A3E77_08950 [Sphingopyxis sp. RIFCSPHIGHO2_12_FULL_65_19]
MFIRCSITALAAIALPASAMAQTAANPFECALPHKAAMQSLGSLTVVNQKPGSPATAFLGEISSVEFAPAGVKVLGATPSKLILTIIGPTTKPGDKRLSVTLSSYFLRNAANEKTLNAAGWTSSCVDGVRVCGRDQIGTKDSASITYMRDDPRELSIVCRYSLTTDDLE